MFDRYCVIDMFGPFYGENWYPPEIADGLSFRWTGPHERSAVRTPTLGARDLRLRWTFPILPQEHQLEAVQWSVNDQSLSPQWTMRSGYATLWADVHLPRPAPVMKLSITVPHRLRTAYDDAEDTRALGLAVHKLELFALDPDVLGVEAQRLRGELDAREREIADLQNSTSWKMSRPLRWLKERLAGARHSPHSASSLENVEG